MKINFVRTGILAVFLIVALFVFPAQPAHAAACTFTSNVSGTWTTAGSWTAVGTACSTYPGQTFAGDTVIIADGDTITLDVSPANALASLTVNGTLYMNGVASTNRTLTVTGDVTISSPNGEIRPGNLSGTNTHTLNIGGNFTNNDMFTRIEGTNDTINVVLNGTTAQTIGGTSTTTFNNLTLSNTSATVSATTGFNVAGTMTINANVLFSPSTGVILSNGTGTLTGSGTIQVTRITDGNDLAEQYNFNTRTLTNMTVDYAGAGNQGIDAYTYGALIISGSGTKTTENDFTVNGIVTINSGATLLLGANDDVTMNGPNSTLTVNGTLDFGASGSFQSAGSGTHTVTIGVSATIRTSDSDGLGPAGTNTSFQTNGTGQWNLTSLETNGTVEYYLNAAQPVADRNYNNLTITNANTKTWTLGGTRTVNGNLTINSGAPLTLVNAQTVNVRGNFTNNGTFTPGTSTVAFTGTSAQTIGGSSATTFNNLTINNANDVTLAQNATVTGALALTAGDLIAGNGTNQLLLSCTPTVASVTSAGGGDVVGDVVRTCAFAAGTNYTFNNPNTLLNFASGGTFPTSVLINLVRTKPPQLQIAVPRTYTLTPTGGSGYSATLRLRYANDELTDMNEIFLRLWRFNGTRYMLQGGAVTTDATNPYVSRSGVTEFSPWAISDNGSVTAVNLSHFVARPDISTDYTIPAFIFSLLGLMAVGAFMLWRN